MFLNLHLLDGTIFIEGKNVKPAEWIAGELPLAMNIRSGVGDFKIWSGLQHSQLVSLVADAQLQQLQLTRPEQGAFSSQATEYPVLLGAQ